MQIHFNSYTGPQNFYGQNKKRQVKNPQSQNSSRPKQEKEIAVLLKPFSFSKKATIPPMALMKGVNPNQRDVFECFNKIDDVTRSINFVKSEEAWNDCMLEEMQEFIVARREYQLHPTQQNYDHMEEEMGDIFYTAASIAKDSKIDPEEAFRATNRKFYNRINLMERILYSEQNGKNLKDCRDFERRALWNAAKRKIYDAVAIKYQAQEQQS